MAFFDGGDGANQRVWNLPSKGEVFRDLLRHPVVRTFARHVLEGDYCLSSHTANIAGPGGVAMGLHSDQGYAPARHRQAAGDERDVDAQRLHRGERRHPARARAPTAGPTSRRATRPWRPSPASARRARRWCSTGASGTAPAPTRRPTTAATACSRTSAGRGCGRRRTTRCRPTPMCSTTLDDELRALLGLRVWRTLGGVEGPWGPGTPEASGFRTDGFVAPPRAPDRRAALTPTARSGDEGGVEEAAVDVVDDALLPSGAPATPVCSSTTNADEPGTLAFPILRGVADADSRSASSSPSPRRSRPAPRTRVEHRGVGDAVSEGPVDDVRAARGTRPSSSA